MNLSRKKLNYEKTGTEKNTKEYDTTLKVGDLIVIDDEICSRSRDMYKNAVNYRDPKMRMHRVKGYIERAFGIWQITRVEERSGSNPLIYIELKDTSNRIIAKESIDAFWCHRATPEIINYLYLKHREELALYQMLVSTMKTVTDVLNHQNGRLFV